MASVGSAAVGVQISAKANLRDTEPQQDDYYPIDKLPPDNFLTVAMNSFWDNLYNLWDLAYTMLKDQQDSMLYWFLFFLQNQDWIKKNVQRQPDLQIPHEALLHLFPAKGRCSK